MGEQALAAVFLLETRGAARLGKGMGRESEAWLELAASRFVLSSDQCQRHVSEQACALCAAGMGNNCFTC